MWVEEISIEGFKSYARMAVLSGLDPAFNAVTGLNGSGKSNVLDAICFVLGISNLEQVRASSLQELVYKQGQAGVSRASVSITFNNSDSRRSPVGYEHCERISVSRQVVIGGRSTYRINGKKCSLRMCKNSSTQSSSMSTTPTSSSCKAGSKRCFP
jgi:structural maintenance of chromosome 2